LQCTRDERKGKYGSIIFTPADGGGEKRGKEKGKENESDSGRKGGPCCRPNLFTGGGKRGERKAPVPSSPIGKKKKEKN